MEGGSHTLKRSCVWIQVEAEVYPSSLHSWLLSKEKVNENWNHSTWANLHLIWNIVVFFKKSLVQWCLAISHFPPAFTLNVSSDAFAIFSFQHWTRLGNIFSLLLKIIYLTCLVKPTSSQRSASISLCKRENQKDNQYQGTRLKINRKRCFYTSYISIFHSDKPFSNRWKKLHICVRSGSFIKKDREILWNTITTQDVHKIF